jgi:hypothetical protein
VRNFDVEPHSIGNFDIECCYCGARTWPGETLSCCDRGALVLPLFPAAPLDLADLIYCSHVQQHIRKYNSALSMASVGHKSKGLNWGAFILGVIGRGSEVNWPLTPNQHYQFGLLIFPTSDSRFAWVSK